MKHPIFYNSDVQKILKEFHLKKMKYAIKGIKKENYEILQEIENEKI